MRRSGGSRGARGRRRVPGAGGDVAGGEEVVHEGHRARGREQELHRGRGEEDAVAPGRMASVGGGPPPGG